MNTIALENSEYQFVDSAKMTGHSIPTIHIDNSVYVRVELLLDQFLSERANLDYLRDFHCLVALRGGKELSVKIDSMLVSWRRVEAEDGVWYEPREIHPIWHESYLFDEEGERLPHDFDIHIILNRLTSF